MDMFYNITNNNCNIKIISRNNRKNQFIAIRITAVCAVKTILGVVPHLPVSGGTAVFPARLADIVRQNQRLT